MKIAARIASGSVLSLVLGIAIIHAGTTSRDSQTDGPEAEFQMARLKYRTFGGGGSHGYWQPWWAIDYPLAEEHFFPALRRSTNIQVSEDERQLEITDDRIFQYPFLLMQQPGRGEWDPNPLE